MYRCVHMFINICTDTPMHLLVTALKSFICLLMLTSRNNRREPGLREALGAGTASFTSSPQLFGRRRVND